jgi:hypothetical protein
MTKPSSASSRPWRQKFIPSETAYFVIWIISAIFKEEVITAGVGKQSTILNT